MDYKPYNEQRNGNIIYRNFSQDIDESELIWHVDKEDRYVKVLNESDWGFQMDNELPIKLSKGTELFIPKETYHRVLKGRSDLNILIKEGYDANGIDFVFNQTPELNQIGTKEQYSAYLSTIFPNSKDKSIFYHGTPFIENKDDYFRDSNETGVNDRGEANIRLWNYFFKNRNRAIDYGDQQYAVLLNFSADYNSPETLYKYSPTYMTNDSAIVLAQGGDEFVVRTKKQIHILGSKQDIEGFRNFVNRNKQTQFEGMEVSKRQLQDEELTAYHGSPHSFDKFSTQYIGTGEGNQSFGWGLYFTDLEDVAKYYANQLARKKRKQSGVIYPRPEYIGVDFLNVISKKIIPSENEFMLILEKEKNRVSKEIKKTDNFEYELKLTEYLESLNKIKSLSDALDNKYFYKVSLHKGKRPEQYTWLEWDKPVNEDILNKITNAIKTNKIKTNMLAYNNESKIIDEISKYSKLTNGGRNVYDILTTVLQNSDKEASLFLLRAGIDGIKYPAESATSDTARGFNYVVFDENAVSIEKQTQLEGMEVSKKDLIQNWLNNPKKLREDAEQFEITKSELEEAKKKKKKKDDRCTRIAKSKYDVWPSAYASGAVVKCRQGKIWKNLKEEEESQMQSFEQKVEATVKALSQVDDKFLTDKIREKATYASYNMERYMERVPTGRQDRFMNDIYKFQVTNPFTDEKIIFKKRQDAAQYLLNQLSFDNIGSTQRRRNIVATAYHIAKENGSNPELVNEVETLLSKQIDEKWSEKYKRSIDCNNPKGFSQKAHCKGRLKEEEESLDEKTDFSKEKSKGLHGWFERQGGKGKSKGWVDCNTCRTDPKTGRKKCKTCGRQEGEKRAKYPACRPTPSACGSKGRGKSWGKKSANEELSVQDWIKEEILREYEATVQQRDIKFEEDLNLKNIIKNNLNNISITQNGNPITDRKVLVNFERNRMEKLDLIKANIFINGINFTYDSIYNTLTFSKINSSLVMDMDSYYKSYKKALTELLNTISKETGKRIDLNKIFTYQLRSFLTENVNNKFFEINI